MKKILFAAVLALGVLGAVVANATLLTANQKKMIELSVGNKTVGENISDATDDMLQRRGVHGTVLSTATDLTRAEMRLSKVYYSTPKGGTDVDVSNDADFTTDDIGLEFIFVITSAGDSAQGLTITDGASGVVVKRINTVGTSCEDLTDKIVCTVTAAERLDCMAFCAD